MYLRTIALALLLAGCQQAADSPATAPTTRANSIRVLNSPANLRVGGAPITQVRLTGHDETGNQIAGPIEEPYDADMTFAGLPASTRKVTMEFQRGPGFTLSKKETTVDFVNDDDGQVEVPAATALESLPPKTTFSVRIVNNSDYPDDQVFVAVNGQDRAKTEFLYLNFAQKIMQKFGGKDRSAEYSEKLTNLTKEAAPHSYSFDCPFDALVSGRIYLSFGKKLQGIGLTNVTSPLSLELPSPTGFPDYQTLFEFMELSATIPDDPKAPQVYTLFVNTSVVDFFSIGINMELDYYDGSKNTSQEVGFQNDARNQVLAEFESSTTPEAFRDGSYIRSADGRNILRVLSPVKLIAIQPTGSLSRFLDPAINAAWQFYRTNTLNIPDTLPSHTFGYRWTGLPINAVDNLLKMTCVAKPAGDTAQGDLESLGEVCQLPPPTSRIVFFCDDDSNPPGPVRNTYRNDGSDGHKRLVSLISAGLNRGVFETYNDWGTAAKFYTRADNLYNHYSKIMHRWALDAKVYGFGYDDVYGQDPTLARTLSDVNQVVITIPKVPVL